MGGPMTYRRFLNRNGLADGGYDPRDNPRGILLGDLRRFEHDLIEVYANRWASDLDLNPGDVRRVLDKVLTEP